MDAIRLSEKALIDGRAYRSLTRIIHESAAQPSRSKREGRSPCFRERSERKPEVK